MERCGGMEKSSPWNWSTDRRLSQGNEKFTGSRIWVFISKVYEKNTGSFWNIWMLVHQVHTI